MHGDIYVIVGARVNVDSMEAGTGAVDDFQPLTFLHCQVNQLGFVWQVRERLGKEGETVRMRVGGQVIERVEDQGKRQGSRVPSEPQSSSSPP